MPARGGRQKRLLKGGLAAESPDADAPLEVALEVNQAGRDAGAAGGEAEVQTEASPVVLDESTGIRQYA